MKVKTANLLSWLVRYFGYFIVLWCAKTTLEDYGLNWWEADLGAFVVAILVGIFMTEGYVKQ